MNTPTLMQKEKRTQKHTKVKWRYSIIQTNLSHYLHQTEKIMQSNEPSDVLTEPPKKIK